MLRIYAILVIVGLLGGVGYAARSYYHDTQNTIKVLQGNNAKLEIAAETAEASTKALMRYGTSILLYETPAAKMDTISDFWAILEVKKITEINTKTGLNKLSKKGTQLR